MAIRLLIGADPAAPDFEFQRPDIKAGSFKIVESVDVVGSELAADEMYADVDYTSGVNIIFAPADYDAIMSSDGYVLAGADITADLSAVPYGTPVWVLEDNTTRHKMYFKEAVRIDPRTYALTAQSGVGTLERRRHLGGLYAGETVSVVLAEIIGDAFGYSVDPAVGAQAVYGLLLADSARKNLHKLLFALGISIVKEAGNVHFVFLDAETEGSIPAARTFLGGAVTYQTPVTAVEVTEHAYYVQSENTETIFDNSGGSAVDHALIEFREAYSGLSATGSLTINESGATYAIVSGSGVLSGKPYAHQTRVVRLDAGLSASDGEKTIKSQEDTLINGLNSQSVAHRLLNYYSRRQIVNVPVRLNGEQPGYNVDFAGPFGDAENGFILKSESVISGFEKANLKLLVGYVPTGQGNWYSHRLAVTASGTITIPVGVSHVRMVLIQGGAGGRGGYDGANGYGGDKATGGDLTFVDGRSSGSDVYYEYAGGRQNTPAGGNAGAAGTAGKVLVVDLDVTPGSSVVVVVGAGGAGGSVNGGYGAAGGHTTATINGETYSSASGAVVAAYVDPLTGDSMAMPGAAGQPGGSGGRTDLQALRAYSGAAGYPGAGVGSYAGGGGGAGARDASWVHMASGGGGGGAAYGATGFDGEAGRVIYQGTYSRWRMFGGAGGAGANAAAPAVPTYGCGGAGGNGGGAGGNGAGCRELAMVSPLDQFFPGVGGSGGAGSAGGNGGAGIMVLYY